MGYKLGTQAALEAEKGKEMDSPPNCQKECNLLDTLILGLLAS